MCPQAPPSHDALPLAPEYVGPVPDTLAGRAPEDGWTLASPHPLGAGTQRALAGLIRALCPWPPAPWSDDIALRVESGVRVFIRYLPPLMGVGFIPMIHLLDWAPLWSLRATQPLHRMDRAAASEVLQALSSSRLKPIRLMIMAARAAVLSSYYDLDEVHEAIGYHPMPFLRERAALRRRLMAGEPTGAGDLIERSPEVL
jgi:hypothetical protein